MSDQLPLLEDGVNNPSSSKADLKFSNLFTDAPLYLRNIARLSRYHNIHRGKRCFILGNGPSLSTTDLTPLKNEITFGLNRIYLLFNTLGFSTTYLVSTNRYVIEQFAPDFVKLPCVKFINWYSRHAMPFTKKTVFVRPGFKQRFSKHPVYSGVWEGATVTFVAMQLAYYMGFSKVILVGVDHRFETQGEPHKLILSDRDDPNHFDPNYFGKGIHWQLPDLSASEVAYRMAKEHFESDGREIVDATVGGALTVFPKVNYDELKREIAAKTFL